MRNRENNLVKIPKPIKQILLDLKEIEAKTNTYLNSVGYKSDLSSLKYKHLISLYNSVSIVLLHFSLDIHALRLLQKSLKIDIKMFYSGSFADKSWNGRVLIYCNLSYLFLKCDDIRSCLKFLYDSENLIYEIQHSGKRIHDIRLSHSLLTFLALIKIRKLENAEKYLKIAIEAFAKASERFNEVSCHVIFGILEFLRVFIIEYRKNYYLSVSQIYNYLIAEDPNGLGLKKFWEKISNIKVKGSLELLQSLEFYEIVFVSLFFPFIKKDTPEVNIDELVRIRDQQKKITKFQISKIISNGKRIQQDNYSLLMKKALEEVTFEYSLN